MRKFKLLLLPLLILSLTACNKSPEETFYDAYNKTKELESLHLDFDIDMSIKSSGIEMNAPMSISMDLDGNKELGSMEMTISILGMKMTSTSFLDMKNNITYEKAPGTSYWTKEINSDNNSDIEFNYANIKKIEEKNNEIHYQIMVSKEDLEKIFSTTDLEDALETSSFHVSKDIEADIYIDKQNSYISRMEADLTGAITTDTNGCIDKECDLEYTKLKISMSLSNYNNVTVNDIGEDIIQNAIDKEAIEVQEYAESYIYEVAYLSFTEHFETFTFTGLEYDGPEPEFVDLYLEDNYVMSGTIVINGYTVTIIDGEIGIPTK